MCYRGYIGHRCHMGRESPTHIAYKKIAVDILKERGFSPLEIKEEYDVEYPVDGRIKYIVDIVGVKDDYKVAVECGKIGLSKLINLRKVFDEVLVIDTAKVVEMYEYWKTKYFTDMNELRRENKRLKEHAEWVCKDANSRIDPLTTEIEKLQGEVRSLKAKLKKWQKVIAEAWEATKEQP